MLLKSYRKEIFRPECNPGFKSVHCIAHLDQNISAVLPYLNAVLGGFKFDSRYTFRIVKSKDLTLLPNQNTRTFVGSYDFHLIKNDERWQIDKFKFNLKYIDGNLKLEASQ